MKPLFAVMAEFASGEAVLAATRAVHAAGYRAIDVHSPVPVEGLRELLALGTRLPIVTFVAGSLGGAGILAFMIWAQAIDWNLDIGGRAAVAVPAFIVPVFEVTVLCAGLATVAAMFLGDRLPMLHHPLFAVPAFERASQDRFFLVVEARDPLFQRDEVRALLAAQAPLEVHDVPG